MHAQNVQNSGIFSGNHGKCHDTYGPVTPMRVNSTPYRATQSLSSYWCSFVLTCRPEYFDYYPLNQICYNAAKFWLNHDSVMWQKCFFNRQMLCSEIPLTLAFGITGGPWYNEVHDSLGVSILNLPRVSLYICRTWYPIALISCLGITMANIETSTL